MIRSALELRGGRASLWATDLSSLDTIFMIPGITFLPFNLSTPEGLATQRAPLLMLSLMLCQSHMTPTPPALIPRSKR